MRVEDALKASPVGEAWRQYYTDCKHWEDPAYNKIIIARKYPGVIYYYIAWEDTGKICGELGGVEYSKKLYGFEDWSPTQI